MNKDDFDRPGLEQKARFFEFCDILSRKDDWFEWLRLFHALMSGIEDDYPRLNAEQAREVWNSGRVFTQLMETRSKAKDKKLG